MDLLISAVTFICASAIALRALCVLDHMNRRTRRSVKLIYALKCAGATLMALLPLLGYGTTAGGLLLLLGVTASFFYDHRTYPPRVLRRRRAERPNMEPMP